MDHSDEEEDYSHQHMRFERRNLKGLLPPAEDLENYDSVLPGSAERIIAMAEEEQQHRHFWEDNALRAYVRSAYYGMVCGLTLGVCILLVTYLLVMRGSMVMAGFVLLVGFCSLSLAYVFSHRYPGYFPLNRRQTPPRTRRR